ncbi:ABC transporter permease [Pseudonocardia dioxanivorans]|uniref:ABC transporter permease n=1 Tax=Pseudonocardia dioxanivorans TaxID=240495 RepID=UPI000CD12A3E|nr:ABC transporter permease [Pseudonocardia dioxanivorans]
MSAGSLSGGELLGVSDRPAATRRRRRRRPVLTWLAVGWLGLAVLCAVTAQWLPLPAYGVVIGRPGLAPQLSWDLLLGTDVLGRSVFSRLVYGAQVSLIVGAVSSLVAFALGTVLGLLAGYLRGWFDTATSYLSDAMLAFPPLVLLLAVSSILRPSLPTILFALTVIVVPTFVRLARANTLRWASREFVRAAVNMGAGRGRIMVREILPNLLPSLAAYLPVVTAMLIVAEGSLSFLGYGIPSPIPSWGGMIDAGKDQIATRPLLVFVPAAAIFATVFALNIVGDRLQSRFAEPRR